MQQRQKLLKYPPLIKKVLNQKILDCQQKNNNWTDIQTEIIDRYSLWALEVIEHFIGYGIEIEDLYQSAILAIINVLREYNINDPYSLLYRITNKLLSTITEMIQSITDETAGPLSNNTELSSLFLPSNPEKIIVQKDLLQRLDACFKTLSTRERFILEQLYLKEDKIESIGQRMPEIEENQISRQWANALKDRALDALRQKIDSKDKTSLLAKEASAISDTTDNNELNKPSHLEDKGESLCQLEEPLASTPIREMAQVTAQETMAMDIRQIEDAIAQTNNPLDAQRLIQFAQIRESIITYFAEYSHSNNIRLLSDLKQKYCPELSPFNDIDLITELSNVFSAGLSLIPKDVKAFLTSIHFANESTKNKVLAPVAICYSKKLLFNVNYKIRELINKENKLMALEKVIKIIKDNNLIPFPGTINIVSLLENIDIFDLISYDDYDLYWHKTYEQLKILSIIEELKKPRTDISASLLRLMVIYYLARKEEVPSLYNIAEMVGFRVSAPLSKYIERPEFVGVTDFNKESSLTWAYQQMVMAAVSQDDALKLE